MYKVYKVVPGDTIESIAKKFNTSVKDLKEINNKDYIEIGELIVVPNNSTDSFFNEYIVEKGDSLYAIARKYNMSLIDLLNINGLDKEDYIYPNQKILVPKDNVKVIITGNDETINSASKRLGLNTEELLYQNDNIFLLPEQLLIYKK